MPLRRWCRPSTLRPRPTRATLRRCGTPAAPLAYAILAAVLVTPYILVRRWDRPAAPPPPPPPPLPSLVVHVVPTSHLDPGWLATFDEYAAGPGYAIVEGAVLASLCTAAAGKDGGAGGAGISQQWRFTLSDPAFVLRWLQARGSQSVAVDDADALRVCGPFLDDGGAGAAAAGGGGARDSGGAAEALGPAVLSRLARAAAIPTVPGADSRRYPTWWQAFLFSLSRRGSSGGGVELTSGGWVQSDEALTPAWLGREQLSLGRRMLARALGPLLRGRALGFGVEASTTVNATQMADAAVLEDLGVGAHQQEQLLMVQQTAALLDEFPSLRVAYQNDAFGHTGGAAGEFGAHSLGAGILRGGGGGFDHLVLNRLPFREKVGRRRAGRAVGRRMLEPTRDAPAGEIAPRLPPYAAAGADAAVSFYDRHCAMQAGGRETQRETREGPSAEDQGTERAPFLFTHVLHEHYNHPLLHPVLKGLGVCKGGGGVVTGGQPFPPPPPPPPPSALVDAWASALLSAGRAVAGDFCSGYPRGPLHPGHALLLIGDDFSHSGGAAGMACLRRHLNLAIKRAEEMGRQSPPLVGGRAISQGAVLPVLSSLREYLDAASAQHSLWRRAFADAGRAADDTRGHSSAWVRFPLSSRDRQPVSPFEAVEVAGGFAWSGGGVESGVMSADASLLPAPRGRSGEPGFRKGATTTSLSPPFSLRLLPHSSALLPYQDRPWSNAWTGFFGTAPALKLAVAHASRLHALSLGVCNQAAASAAADNALAAAGVGDAGGPDPQPAAVVAAFAQQCTTEAAQPTTSARYSDLREDTGRMEACMLRRTGAACGPLAAQEPRGGGGGEEEGVALATPVDARAARLFVALHHDGLTGTSRPHVLRDYAAGAELAALHADACLRWAALFHVGAAGAEAGIGGSAGRVMGAPPLPERVIVLPSLGDAAPRPQAEGNAAANNGLGVGELEHELALDAWREAVWVAAAEGADDEPPASASSARVLLRLPRPLVMEEEVRRGGPKAQSLGRAATVLRIMMRCDGGLDRTPSLLCSAAPKDLQARLDVTAVLPPPGPPLPRLPSFLHIAVLHAHSSKVVGLDGRASSVRILTCVLQRGKWVGEGASAVDGRVTLSLPRPQANKDWGHGAAAEPSAGSAGRKSSSGALRIAGFAVSLRTVPVSRLVGLGGGAYVFRTPTLALAAHAGCSLAGSGLVFLVHTLLSTVVRRRSCTRRGAPTTGHEDEAGRTGLLGCSPAPVFRAVAAGFSVGILSALLLADAIYVPDHHLRGLLGRDALWWSFWACGAVMAAICYHGSGGGARGRAEESEGRETTMLPAGGAAFFSLRCEALHLFGRASPRLLRRVWCAGASLRQCCRSGLSASPLRHHRPRRAEPLAPLLVLAHTSAVCACALMLASRADSLVRPIAPGAATITTTGEDGPLRMHASLGAGSGLLGRRGRGHRDEAKEATCIVEAVTLPSANAAVDDGSGGDSQSSDSQSSNGAEVELSVACSPLMDTELFLSVEREREREGGGGGGGVAGAKGMGKENSTAPGDDVQWEAAWPQMWGDDGAGEAGFAEASPYARLLGDDTLEAAAATLVSGVSMWAAGQWAAVLGLLRVPAYPMPRSQHQLRPHPRLCVKDAAGWMARPSPAPGVDFPAALWPVQEVAAPCEFVGWAPDAGDGGGRRAVVRSPTRREGKLRWALWTERPGGVAWVPTATGWAALFLLDRATSVDDEKGLGAGAVGGWEAGAAASPGRRRLIARLRVGTHHQGGAGSSRG